MKAEEPCINKNLDNECVLGKWDDFLQKYPECNDAECPFTRAFRADEYDQKLTNMGKPGASDQYEEDQADDLGNIPFGIYKGGKWLKCPIEYLEFLVSEKCTISQGLKDIAKLALAQKRIIPGKLKFFKEAK